jgi:hypothetical protein
MNPEPPAVASRRNPTTGVADGCARAASGHAAAVPPCRRAAEQRHELAPLQPIGRHCAHRQPRERLKDTDFVEISQQVRPPLCSR